jgi:putative lipoprotein
MMRSPAGLAVILGMALVACSTGSLKVEPLPPGLAGTSWRAETITGLPVLDGVDSTLTFVGTDRVQGLAACNRYQGSITTKEGRVRMGPLAATRMACAPPVMEQERRFTTALEQAHRFELDGPVLVLYSAGRPEPTRFRPLESQRG